MQTIIRRYPNERSALRDYNAVAETTADLPFKCTVLIAHQRADWFLVIAAPTVDDLRVASEDVDWARGRPASACAHCVEKLIAMAETRLGVSA